MRGGCGEGRGDEAAQRRLPAVRRDSRAGRAHPHDTGAGHAARLRRREGRGRRPRRDGRPSDTRERRARRRGRRDNLRGRRGRRHRDAAGAQNPARRARHKPRAARDDNGGAALRHRRAGGEGYDFRAGRRRDGEAHLQPAPRRDGRHLDTRDDRRRSPDERGIDLRVADARAQHARGGGAENNRRRLRQHRRAGDAQGP